MGTNKQYARALAIADRKTALENARLIDGYRLIVEDDDRGIRAVVVRAADGQYADATDLCSSYDGAYAGLRRHGWLVDCPIDAGLRS